MTFSYASLILLTSSLALHSACSKSRLSEREVRREQIRINAESKKRELSAIAGDYAGPLQQSSGVQRNQDVALHLEVIETPFNDNGGIDPVMMPQLSGFLKFPYGAAGNSQEFLGFAIQRGEFDPVRGNLELVVKHEQYGDMQLTLSSNAEGFAGRWQALGLSLSGDMTLRKQTAAGIAVTTPSGGPQPTPAPAESVTGSYFGYADDDARGTSYGTTLQIRSVNIPGKGFVLSGDIKLARGSEGREYALWKFETIDFNPLTGTLTLKKEASLESFVLTRNNSSLIGYWQSSSLGRLGAVSVQAAAPYPRSQLHVASERTGRYDVCLKNFGGARLYPQAAITLAVTPTSQADGKVNTQATMVFFVGDYDSDTRFTCSMVQVDLDYLSGRFQGLCKDLPNADPMTISGTFATPGFSGKLIASGGFGADISAGRCKGGSTP